MNIRSYNRPRAKNSHKVEDYHWKLAIESGRNLHMQTLIEERSAGRIPVYDSVYYIYRNILEKVRKK